MSNLVGIIRTETEIKKALAELDDARRPGADGVGAGRQRLQPRLAPGARHAQHHADGQVRGDGRAGAPGEPRRPHPRRLSGHAAGLAQDQPGLRARGRRDHDHPAADADDARRPDRAVRPERAEEVPDARRRWRHCRRRPALPRPQRARRATDELQGSAAGVARRPRSGRPRRLLGRGQRGRGRPRRAAPPAGDSGRRPGHPVELQGRQVRIVLHGDQRPPAAGLHDADVHVHRGRGADDHAAAHLPGDQGPGHRRLVQLRQGA